MEFKHFSHPHALSYHQTTQTREAICSGCKSHLSSGSVYSCWQCNFILHEQCFNATRSMDHPSHPSHPLTLFPSPTYPSGSFFCNFCNLTGTGFSYSCSRCEFDLHVHCSYMPLNPNHGPYPSLSNQTHSSSQEIGTYNLQYPQTTAYGNVFAGLAPQHTQTPYARITEPPPYGLPGEIQHKSHPQHSLVFLLSPPYKENGEFTCNACALTGTAFDYHCKICKFDLHVGCARLSENVKREDHQHPLKLLFSSPYKKGEGAFCCDVCQGVVEEGCWVYYCQECDFGTHLVCVMADREEADEETEQISEADSLVAAQMRLQQLQLQTQMNQQVVKMSQQNAQFMISMGQSLANLAG